VFVDRFNVASAVAATPCPRCNASGLVEIDGRTYRNASKADKQQARFIIDPSVFVQCPACRLVAEWPACKPEGVSESR
jgi:hypothetical protein